MLTRRLGTNDVWMALCEGRVGCFTPELLADPKHLPLRETAFVFKGYSNYIQLTHSLI